MSLDFYITYPAPHTDDFNITHNLAKMASEAGVYQCLWQPEENGFLTAADCIPILERGLRDLRARPEHFRQFEPENGWGTYDGFVSCVAEILESCHKHPEGEVTAHR